FSDENIQPLTDGIKTFLDIAWSGQEPRRVYIKMLGNTARARQHLLMVTGQCGVSYRDLHIYNPINQGKSGEYLPICPHNSKEAMSLLKDLTATDNVNNHVKKAGLVAGARYCKNSNNMIVIIYLTDDPEKETKTGFAQVISGLEIFQDIAKCNDKSNIKIVDCGVVLS
ncbi:unnamed protein product, partial [Meganyctiphanes norvegica]